MHTLREIPDGLTRTLDLSVDWMELVRDVEAPIFMFMRMPRFFGGEA
jgi:hypothetical protein